MLFVKYLQLSAPRHTVGLQLIELYWLSGDMQLVLAKGLGYITSKMDCLTARERLLEISFPLPQGMRPLRCWLL